MGFIWDLLQWLSRENPPANERDVGWVPGSGNPLEEGKATHSSILAGNPVDRGAWEDTVHRVRESDLTEHTHTSLQQDLKTASRQKAGPSQDSPRLFPIC